MTGPRFLLDANVLYPTVMREMLLGVAETGAFAPCWTGRVLEEWRRAAAKRGSAEALQAEGEIALLKSRWPDANVAEAAALEARLWLPDPADRHVLAAAVQAGCDGIVTRNLKDFPPNLLAEHGLSRVEPDAFLLGLLRADPARVIPVAEQVLATARELSGEAWTIRALMRKARLPRLGKALEAELG